MLLLSSTSSVLQVVTGTAVDAIEVQASWVDLMGTTVTPGDVNTVVTTAATTVVVPSPAGATQRNIKYLSVFNTSGSPCPVTIQHFDGTTPVTTQTLASTDTAETQGSA